MAVRRTGGSMQRIESRQDDPRQRGEVCGPDSGRSHLVKKTDTFTKVSKRYYGGDPETRSLDSLPQVLRVWMERRAEMGEGPAVKQSQELSSLEGQVVALPEPWELAALHGELKDTGKLPDARSFGRIKRDLARSTITADKPRPGLGALRPPWMESRGAKVSPGRRPPRVTMRKPQVPKVWSGVAKFEEVIAEVRARGVEGGRAVEELIWHRLKLSGPELAVLLESARDLDQIEDHLEELLDREGFAGAFGLTARSVAHGLRTKLADAFFDRAAVQPVRRAILKAVEQSVRRTEILTQPKVASAVAQALSRLPPDKVGARLMVLGFGDPDLAEAIEKLDRSPGRIADELRAAAREQLAHLGEVRDRVTVPLKGTHELFKLAPAITRAVVESARYGIPPDQLPSPDGDTRNAAAEALVDGFAAWDRGREAWVRVALGALASVSTMGMGGFVFGGAVSALWGSGDLIIAADRMSLQEGLARAGIGSIEGARQGFRNAVVAYLGSVAGSVALGKLTEGLAAKAALNPTETFEGFYVDIAGGLLAAGNSLTVSAATVGYEYLASPEETAAVLNVEAFLARGLLAARGIDLGSAWRTATRGRPMDRKIYDPMVACFAALHRELIEVGAPGDIRREFESFVAAVAKAQEER